MKIKMGIILIIIVSFLIVSMTGCQKIQQRKGGEGTGMFDFPEVSTITISTKEGKTVKISDPKIIKEIQSLCRKESTWSEVEEMKDKTCDIWVDFNNTRAVIGMCSDGSYGNLQNKKQTKVNIIIGKELYYYIMDLIK